MDSFSRLWCVATYTFYNNENFLKVILPLRVLMQPCRIGENYKYYFCTFSILSYIACWQDFIKLEIITFTLKQNLSILYSINIITFLSNHLYMIDDAGQWCMHHFNYQIRICSDNTYFWFRATLLFSRY